MDNLTTAYAIYGDKLLESMERVYWLRRGDDRHREFYEGRPELLACETRVASVRNQEFFDISLFLLFLKDAGFF